MKFFNLSMKSTAIITINLGIFHSALKSNAIYENKIKSLPVEEYEKLHRIDRALANHPFYLSESPHYLRVMLLASYHSNPEPFEDNLQTITKPIPQSERPERICPFKKFFI